MSSPARCRISRLTIPLVGLALVGWLASPSVGQPPNAKEKSVSLKDKDKKALPLPVSDIAAHTGPVSALSISPDGRLILSGGVLDRTVKVWDFATGQEVFGSNPLEGSVGHVAFFPSGKQFVSGTSAEKETVVVWDLETGRAVRGMGLKGMSLGFANAGDGKTMVRTVRRPGKVDPIVEYQVLELNQFRAPLVFRPRKGDHGVGLAVDPVKKLLLAEHVDHQIGVWNTSTGDELRKLSGHDAAVSCAATDVAGKTAISSGDDGVVRQWDLTAGKPMQILRGHTTPVTCLAMDSAGNTAISIDRTGQARVWDIPRSTETALFDVGKARVHAVCLTPNADFAVTGHADGQIRVWDLRTRKQVRRCEPTASWQRRSILLSKQKQLITVSPTTHRIFLWELPNGKTPKFEFVGHRELVTHLFVMKNGTRLISASWDRTIRVWDLVTGETISTVSGHPDAIEQIRLSTDEKLCFAAYRNGSIGCYDCTNGKRQFLLEGHEARIAVMTVEGTTMASADVTGMVHIWDVATGKERQQFSSGKRVTGLELSPDGQKVCVRSGSVEGPGMVYETKTGKIVDRTVAQSDPWTRSHMNIPAVSSMPSSGGGGGGGGSWIIEYVEY